MRTDEYREKYRRLLEIQKTLNGAEFEFLSVNARMNSEEVAGILQALYSETMIEQIMLKATKRQPIQMKDEKETEMLQETKTQIVLVKAFEGINSKHKTDNMFYKLGFFAAIERLKLKREELNKWKESQSGKSKDEVNNMILEIDKTLLEIEKRDAEKLNEQIRKNLNQENPDK